MKTKWRLDREQARANTITKWLGVALLYGFLALIIIAYLLNITLN